MTRPACTDTRRSRCDIALPDEALNQLENTPTLSTNAREITIGVSGSARVDRDSIKHIFCSFYCRTAGEIHTESRSTAKLQSGAALRAKGYYLMFPWTISELTLPRSREIAPPRAHIRDIRPLPDQIGKRARHGSPAAVCRKPVS